MRYGWFWSQAAVTCCPLITCNEMIWRCHQSIIIIQIKTAWWTDNRTVHSCMPYMQSLSYLILANLESHCWVEILTISQKLKLSYSSSATMPKDLNFDPLESYFVELFYLSVWFIIHSWTALLAAEELVTWTDGCPLLKMKVVRLDKARFTRCRMVNTMVLVLCRDPKHAQYRSSIAVQLKNE